MPNGDTRNDSGVSAVLVEPTEDDSAIVVVNDAIIRAGFRVPEDVSVALLGDPPLSEPDNRDWTRFALPRTHMGRQAVRLLLELPGQPLG